MLSCRPHTVIASAAKQSTFLADVPMDCFATLAMTTNQIHRRRPAQAKRDAGPKTIGRRLCQGHRTASLQTNCTAHGSLLSQERHHCHCERTKLRRRQHSLTFARVRSRAFWGVLRMDTISLVTGLLAAQAGNVQTQIAATILKSNADAEKSAVLTLLGAAGQNLSSLANVGAGIGGNIDISA